MQRVRIPFSFHRLTVPLDAIHSCVSVHAAAAPPYYPIPHHSASSAVRRRPSLRWSTPCERSPRHCPSQRHRTGGVRAEHAPADRGLHLARRHHAQHRRYRSSDAVERPDGHPQRHRQLCRAVGDGHDLLRTGQCDAGLCAGARHGRHADQPRDMDHRQPWHFLCLPHARSVGLDRHALAAVHADTGFGKRRHASCDHLLRQGHLYQQLRRDHAKPRRERGGLGKQCAGG